MRTLNLHNHWTRNHSAPLKQSRGCHANVKNYIWKVEASSVTVKVSYIWIHFLSVSYPDCTFRFVACRMWSGVRCRPWITLCPELTGSRIHRWQNWPTCPDGSAFNSLWMQSLQTHPDSKYRPTPITLNPRTATPCLDLQLPKIWLFRHNWDMIALHSETSQWWPLMRTVKRWF